VLRRGSVRGEAEREKVPEAVSGTTF